ncbi:hypothetical protein DFP72DRAFT_182246 [Ephemerocybe angulata]|uniref:Uncharacterized protein n=1 Tax=Ephemerocybe angulata TaxID=980116 RepID=A0A8H6LVB9_9AGAR|nr:hypothetical protein DFP72DRAFT_182246 [Tulosesus angulatus]
MASLNAFQGAKGFTINNMEVRSAAGDYIENRNTNIHNDNVHHTHNDHSMTHTNIYHQNGVSGTIVNGSANDSSINGGSGRRPKPKKAATTNQSPREREHRSRTKSEKGSNVYYQDGVSGVVINGGAHKSTINSISTGERTRRKGKASPPSESSSDDDDSYGGQGRGPCSHEPERYQNDSHAQPKPEYQEPHEYFDSGAGQSPYGNPPHPHPTPRSQTVPIPGHQPFQAHYAHTPHQPQWFSPPAHSSGHSSAYHPRRPPLKHSPQRPSFQHPPYSPPTHFESRGMPSTPENHYGNQSFDYSGMSTPGSQVDDIWSDRSGLSTPATSVSGMPSPGFSGSPPISPSQKRRLGDKNPFLKMLSESVEYQ